MTFPRYTAVLLLMSTPSFAAPPRYPASTPAPATRPTTRPATPPVTFRFRIDMPLANVKAALGPGTVVYGGGSRVVYRWTFGGKVVEATFRDEKLNDWETLDGEDDGEGVAADPGGIAPGLRIR